MQGTPGTYLLIQKAIRLIDALVVSPDDNKFVVHSLPDNVPWLPANDFTSNDGFDNIKSAVTHFDPDIFYIFNFQTWPGLVSKLKKNFSNKKIIYDIKTPLLAEGLERKEIQRQGQQAAKYLDAIVALSRESVFTWIPNFDGLIHEYPLGIDLGQFVGLSDFYERKKYEKFVYIGALHPKRKTITLVDYFLKICDRLNLQLQLDLYGRGAEETIIKNEIAANAGKGRVNFKGLLSQRELFLKLQDYDAGIAWVPKTIYSDSPSLKSLEFLAAGLPVIASKTIAHEHLAHKASKMLLFDNTLESMESVLQELFEKNPFPVDVIKKNRETVKQFDYEQILKQYLFPVFEKLTSQTIETGESLCQKSHDNRQLYYKKPKGGNDRSLKIVFLCETLALGKGGAEKTAMNTANEMGKRGHVVYIAYNDKGFPAFQRNQGVVLLPFDSMATLSSKIRQLHPDLFFVSYFNRMLIKFYGLVHETGIPFGMQECTNPDRLLHNNWMIKKIPFPKRCWEREVIASAAHRIRLSMPRYRESFSEYIQSSVRSFPNPSYIQKMLAEPGNMTVSKKVIINIGGMKANKNLVTLLEAFAPLAALYPEWVIKVFGTITDGNQPHKIEIQEVINSNHLEGQVFICGPTDDIFCEFANSHIHVITSLSEGCPNSVLEAMATGLPSIGFADCPGTNELIRDGENGILLSPEDRVSNLSKALRQLMASSELRDKMGKQALNDARQFDPKTIYDQWEQLFYEIAQYKDDPERLFREQMAIEPEKAMHAKRSLAKLIRQLEGN